MLNYNLNKELIISLTFFLLVILIGAWYIIALIPLIFIILYFAFKVKIEYYPVTLLDLSIIFIALSELLTTLFSFYLNNSNKTSYNLFVILFLYVAYKKYFKEPQKIKLFTTILFFLTSILCLITIMFFLVHYHTILGYGFTDFNNYKNLYNPVGVWNNIWATVLLLFLPFTLIFLLLQKTDRIKILGLSVVLLLVFEIVVSFSRGIYLSLIFFALTLTILTFRYFNVRKHLVYSGIALFILVISILTVKNSAFSTLSFNNTTSQQRSSSIRIHRWGNAAQLIMKKPFIGWGNNNYIFAQAEDPFLTEDTEFSPKVDNTYLQILIERGFFGFFAYFFLFVTCCYIIIIGLRSKVNTKKQKLELAIIFSGLIAFSIRETNFSSFLLSNTVYFLIFHLIFFLIPFDIKLINIRISQKFKNVVFFFLFFATSFIIYKVLVNKNLNYNNHRFIEAYNKNEKLEAFDFLNKAIKLSPNNIILNKNKALLLSKEAIQIEISSKDTSFFTFKHLDNDTLEVINKHLKKILTLNPYDDETYHNLGWIYFALDKKDSSKKYFDNALLLAPYNSTYLISKILYDIKGNDFKNMVTNLSKALRYSPEILESVFYRNFSFKYKKIAILAEQEAILGLRNVLEKKDNPILKARLARLLLNKDSMESLKLLEEVTISLPNLNRPWLYRAYIYEKLEDSLKVKNFYDKAIFLNKRDFLPRLYYANYLETIGDAKSCISLYKEALNIFNFLTSEAYAKNKAISDLEIIRNSYIPNELLYYLRPSIPSVKIFNYLSDYYKELRSCYEIT